MKQQPRGSAQNGARRCYPTLPFEIIFSFKRKGFLFFVLIFETEWQNGEPHRGHE